MAKQKKEKHSFGAERKLRPRESERGCRTAITPGMPASPSSHLNDWGKEMLRQPLWGYQLTETHMKRFVERESCRHCDFLLADNLQLFHPRPSAVVDAVLEIVRVTRHHSECGWLQRQKNHNGWLGDLLIRMKNTSQDRRQNLPSTRESVQLPVL